MTAPSGRKKAGVRYGKFYGGAVRAPLSDEEWKNVAGASGLNIADMDARNKLDCALGVYLSGLWSDQNLPTLREIASAQLRIADHANAQADALERFVPNLVGGIARVTAELLTSAEREALARTPAVVRAERALSTTITAYRQAIVEAREGAAKLEAKIRGGRPSREQARAMELGLIADLFELLTDHNLPTDIGSDDEEDVAFSERAFPRTARVLFQMMTMRIAVLAAVKDAPSLDRSAEGLLNGSRRTFLRLMRQGVKFSKNRRALDRQNGGNPR